MHPIQLFLFTLIIFISHTVSAADSITNKPTLTVYTYNSFISDWGPLRYWVLFLSTARKAGYP